MRAVGNTVKVAGRVEPPVAAPPALGGDTDHVLRSVLGYDDDRVAALWSDGVVGGRASPAPVEPGV